MNEDMRSALRFTGSVIAAATVLYSVIHILRSTANAADNAIKQARDKVPVSIDEAVGGVRGNKRGLSDIG